MNFLDGESIWVKCCTYCVNHFRTSRTKGRFVFVPSYLCFMREVLGIRNERSRIKSYQTLCRFENSTSLKVPNTIILPIIWCKLQRDLVAKILEKADLFFSILLAWTLRITGIRSSMCCWWKYENFYSNTLVPKDPNTPNIAREFRYYFQLRIFSILRIN